jgi:hypothetical protein
LGPECRHSAKKGFESMNSLSFIGHNVVVNLHREKRLLQSHLDILNFLWTICCIKEAICCNCSCCFLFTSQTAKQHLILNIRTWKVDLIPGGYPLLTRGNHTRSFHRHIVLMQPLHRLTNHSTVKWSSSNRIATHLPRGLATCYSG